MPGKTRFRSTMSLLLTMALVLGGMSGGLPSAQANEDDKSQELKDDSVATRVTEPTELVEQRTENSKQFLNPDGSMSVRVYGQPVHYKDPVNSKYVPIDSNLELQSDGSYKNKSNLFSVELEDKANAGKVDFTFEGNTMSLRPLFAAAGNTRIMASKHGVAEGNTMKFENLANQVDLNYDVTPTGLKETIVLKSATAPSSYSFEVVTGGLTAKKNEDGSLSFFENGETTPLLTMPRPFMIDAKNEISYDVDFKLQTTDIDKLVLDVVADAAWLRDPNRAYPVQIDPPITVRHDPVLEDTFVQSFSPDTYYDKDGARFSDYQHNLIGNGVDHGIGRALYWFYLPPIPSGAEITNAHFYVQNDKVWLTTQRPVIEARRINKSWNHDTVTWNQANVSGFVSDMAEASYTAKSNPPDWFDFPITKLVQDWYNGTQPNYGVELRYKNEAEVIREVISNNYPDPSHSPYLQYDLTIDGLGGQSFWTFDGPVNMANRNLYLSGTDIAYAGLGTSITLSRAYNSRSAISGLFGYGWSSPLDVRLFVPAEGPARLLEADGSFHYFNQKFDKSGYEPLSGLHWTLEGSGSTWLVKTPEKVTYTFTNGWLTEMRDAAGSTLTYVRDASGKVTSLKDKAGHAITFTYEQTAR